MPQKTVRGKEKSEARAFRWIFGILVVCGVVLASRPGAQQRSMKALAPNAGVFLVAEPQLLDPRFHRSVVLLVDHEKEGAAGLIVNRPTGARLGEAVPPLQELDRGGHVVFFGGPVAIDGLTFLVRSSSKLDGAKRILGDVYWGGSAESLRSLLQDGKLAANLRIFAGYSGWGAGQLEAEIARGDWRLVAADPSAVFARDPTTLWDELMDKAGPKEIPIRWRGGTFHSY